MLRKIGIAACLCTVTLLVAAPCSATVSVLAYDAETEVLGAAVISCLEESSADFKLAEVVRLVPLAGGVVAQSYFFEQGRDTVLGALVSGKTAEQALLTVTNDDFDPLGNLQGYAFRQYGVLDTVGGNSAFTGAEAVPSALHTKSTVGAVSYVVAGNYLTEQAVVTTLSQGFTQANGNLAERLDLAFSLLLERGGGDKRCSPRSSNRAYAQLVLVNGASWEREIMSASEEPIRLLIDALRSQELLTKTKAEPPSAGPIASGQSSSCRLSPVRLAIDNGAGYFIVALLFPACRLRRRRLCHATRPSRLI